MSKGSDFDLGELTHSSVVISFDVIVIDQKSRAFNRFVRAVLTVDGVDVWSDSLNYPHQVAEEQICGRFDTADSKHHIRVRVSHSASSLGFNFTSYSKHTCVGCYWGSTFIAIDNVTVELPRAEAGHARAELNGELWPQTLQYAKKI